MANVFIEILLYITNNYSYILLVINNILSFDCIAHSTAQFLPKTAQWNERLVLIVWWCSGF